MAKETSIPMAMVTRKFYCQKCGEKLKKHPITRVIKRGDPNYKSRNKIGHTHVSGDVTVTEYDFICPSCGKIISFKEQCVIEKIQKRVGKRVLTQDEINENVQAVKTDMERKSKIKRIITDVIAIILFIALVWFWVRSGHSSIKFYF